MILYITKIEKGNIGADMHYRAIQDIKGKNNVFTINLSPWEAERKEKNYIAYGKYKNILERLHRWAQGNMMFINNKMIEEICDIIDEKNIHTVFIEDSTFGNLTRAIKQKYKTCKVLSFYHDVKANLYPQWIKNDKTIKSKIEYTIGIRQEYINQKYADINIMFNQRDANIFEKVYGYKPEAIIPLPAPIPQKLAQSNISVYGANQINLLFVGKKYYPNLVGLQWFADKVMPYLPSNICINIVGRGLEYLKDEYTDVRYNVIGGVESLDPYYRQADIVIAPLFDGGGMKSKTVEALSYGKVFVGTEESLFGFWEEMDDGIRYKKCYQCNTPEEWIKTLNALINSNISKFNKDIFDLFVAKFSYDVVRDQLKRYIEE